MFNMDNYKIQPLKTASKLFSLFLIGASVGCAGLGDKYHNITSPMKKDSNVVRMESNNVNNLPHHKFNELHRKKEPSPNDYENALGHFLKSRYGLNEKQIDAADGKVNEVTPTKDDFIAANYTWAPLLPGMSYSDDVTFAKAPEVFSNVKKHQLDDIVQKDDKNVYTGGSVSFTEMGASPVPSSKGKFFNAQKAGTLNKLLEETGDFTYDHSVQYNILQGGGIVGDLTILGSSKDKKLVRPQVNLHSNAFELGFGNYSIDDIMDSGIDIPSDFSHNLDDNAKQRYLAVAAFSAPVALVNPYIAGGVTVWNLLDATQLQEVLQYAKHTTFNEDLQVGKNDFKSYMNPHEGNLSLIYTIDGKDGDTDALAILNLKNVNGKTEIGQKGVYFSQPHEDDKIVLSSIGRAAAGALLGLGYENAGETETKIIKQGPSKPTGGVDTSYQPGVMYK